jgi:hypothetical protein
MVEHTQAMAVEMVVANKPNVLMAVVEALEVILVLVDMGALNLLHHLALAVVVAVEVMFILVEIQHITKLDQVVEALVFLVKVQMVLVL